MPDKDCKDRAPSYAYIRTHNFKNNLLSINKAIEISWDKITDKMLKKKFTYTLYMSL